MCRFSVNLNRNYSINPGDQGVQKLDLSITFGFNRERDLRVNWIQRVRGRLS